MSLAPLCFLGGGCVANEGRGLCLALHYAKSLFHKLAREILMYKFVDALIDQMGAAYPELVRARSYCGSFENEEYFTKL